MRVKIGNFLFHVRNGLFPLFYVLLFLPGQPFLDHYVALALGFAIALTGQIIRAVTVGLDYIIRGGKNRQVYAERLVTGGLFSHCRNPLYLGNYLILVGVGIASNSLLFVCVALPFFFFAYDAIIAAEENFLRNKFGNEFNDYCARVNRIIPNFSGLKQTVQGMEFNWKRLISKEYGSAFIWVAALIGVTLKNNWSSGYSATHHPTTWILTGLLLLAIAAYFFARYLKKNGFLREEETVA